MECSRRTNPLGLLKGVKKTWSCVRIHGLEAQYLKPLCCSCACAPHKPYTQMRTSHTGAAPWCHCTSLISGCRHAAPHRGFLKKLSGLVRTDVGLPARGGAPHRNLLVEGRSTTPCALPSSPLTQGGSRQNFR